MIKRLKGVFFHFIMLLMATNFAGAKDTLKTMPKDAKIYVAGHRGLVGSAIVRELNRQGYYNIVKRTSKQLDLRRQADVESFFSFERPEYVILVAAKVGGIKANIAYPADFIYDNLMIQTNVMHASYVYGVKKLLFLGSSCIYPRHCDQPMREEYLLNGYLEPTNECYSLAKIAGLKMCQGYNRQYGTKFISCMPTNIYGPGDNFDLETSHALPALMVRMLHAKEAGISEVVVWGSGDARREWLFVDDLAEACVFLMQTYEDNDFVNVGIGVDISMKELAYMIKDIIGYDGNLIFDRSKPEGMRQKLLDVSRMVNLGWKAKTDLHTGIRKTLTWYLQHSA